jgi:HAAS
VSWLDELELELRQARIPVGRRRRIVAELEDHLTTEPGSEERLGSPAAIARQFADELGTVFARRAAFASFLALVPLGILFVALFALAAVYTTNVDAPVTIGLGLGTQLAFVGGTLALLRAWRTRSSGSIAGADARVLVHRAVLAVAGGAITVATLAIAVFQPRGVQWPVPALAYATVGVGALTLTAAAALTARAAAVRPSSEGTVGDLAFDLGIDAAPWRIALVIAGAVALCIAVGGVVQADPIDGLVRGVADGLLCLAGFALLGRRLGLRR